MKFFAYLIIAAIVIPIIMLAQKGLGTISKKKVVKKEMNDANKGLGNIFLIIIVIIFVVILFAYLTRP